MKIEQVPENVGGGRRPNDLMGFLL